MKRPALMIPGPIEFSPAVLAAMRRHGTSHVDPHFIKVFGTLLKQLRDVFFAPDGQPFVLTASGTLGWDLASGNLIRPGQKALVVDVGYFGAAWAENLTSYGAKTTRLECAVGEAPSVVELEAKLRSMGGADLVAMSHVDTSTAVRCDIKAFTAAVRRVSPDAVVCVDGVCATGGEPFYMSEWDVDFCLTGSQKVFGVPPGLSISVARPRAMKRAHENARGYWYGSMVRWEKIMKAYENLQVAYYATPAVSNIYALAVGVEELLSDGGMEARFAEHQRAGEAFRRAMTAIGLGFVAKREEIRANTLTGVLYPAHVDPTKFRVSIKNAGAVTAGGLHAKIKNDYFRVGHMGFSVRESTKLYNVARTIAAIESACIEHGSLAASKRGTALRAAGLESHEALESSEELILTLPTLTAAAGSAMVRAAVTKAQSMGLGFCIAVVDRWGRLLAFHRMEAGKWTSTDIALSKALTAAGHRNPTSAYAANAAFRPGGAAFGIHNSNQGRFSLIGGGVPVKDLEGNVLGAIGVSSGTPAQDEEVCKAAIEALAKKTSMVAKL